MALIRPSAPAPVAGIPPLDAELLDSPAARQALLRGQLQARRQALRHVAALARLGRPLLVGIIFVSALHVWETIAAIRPGWVAELRLQSELYHAAAALLTVAIDLAALFVVAAGAAVALVVPPTGRRAVWFFLALTFLLNMAFVVRYGPALPAELRAAVLPLLDMLFAVLLPAFVPVGIVAVESATGRLDVARLRLVVEVTTLAELVARAAPPAGGTPEKATGSGAGDGRLISPGRPLYTIDQLGPVLALGEFGRADVVALVGCGRTTADRLLEEAARAGLISPAGRRRWAAAAPDTAGAAAG